MPAICSPNPESYHTFYQAMPYMWTSLGLHSEVICVYVYIYICVCVCRMGRGQLLGTVTEELKGG